MTAAANLRQTIALALNRLIKLMSVVISYFAIWLILIKNLFGRFLSIQRSAMPESPKCSAQAILQHYSILHMRRVLQHLGGPGSAHPKYTYNCNCLWFLLLSLLSAFLLSPSPPPPPKDLGFTRISGVDLMTVGGGSNCPQFPPPPPVATLMTNILTH